MMSNERAFLKKLRYATHLENDLRKELEELLAQPEKTEQEPVAWKETMQDIWDVFNDVFIGTTIQKSLAQELIIKAHHAGVKAAQKREPLSDKEITKNTPKLIHIGERLAFHAGVRFAERHHIIGGGE
jgi:hypothetical protein